LPGFDENSYADFWDANNRNMRSLIEEYKNLRQSTIQLFNSFNDNMLKNIGKASSGNMSTRAAGYIIIGHEIHHWVVIKQRYL